MVWLLGLRSLFVLICCQLLDLRSLFFLFFCTMLAVCSFLAVAAYSNDDNYKHKSSTSNWSGSLVSRFCLFSFAASCWSLDICSVSRRQRTVVGSISMVPGEQKQSKLKFFIFISLLRSYCSFAGKAGAGKQHPQLVVILLYFHLCKHLERNNGNHNALTYQGVMGAPAWLWLISLQEVLLLEANPYCD